MIAKKAPSYSDIRKREIAENAIAKVRAVEVDSVASASYFMIIPSAEIIVTTERRVNIDWDRDGNIVGIELLDILAPPSTSDKGEDT